MSKPPTLKDLARVLGLSVPAVSLGLRHAGNISESTCRRIQDAARKMGYRPNPHAAALSTGTHTGSEHGVPLAVLRIPLSQKTALYPVSEFVRGIISRAGELGYRVETFTLKNPGEIPRQLKILYSCGFQGIFLPAIGRDFYVENPDWSSFSIVACGRYELPGPFHTVRQEIFESTTHLLNEIIRRGYRRICVGMLRHEPPILDDVVRTAAAMVCRPSGGKKIQIMFSPDGRNLSDFIRFLKKEKADAAVGFSAAHYHAIRAAGLKIPEEIGFSTLHLQEDEVNRGISGLVQIVGQAGIVAANRMDALIRRHERGIPAVPELIAIRSEWREGDTLPFRAQTKAACV